MITVTSDGLFFRGHLEHARPACACSGFGKGPPTARDAIGCDRLGQTLQRCERQVREAGKIGVFVTSCLGIFCEISRSYQNWG